jgi:hypothetical protein
LRVLEEDKQVIEVVVECLSPSWEMPEKSVEAVQ